MSTHEELPIGPNRCSECGSEFLEHFAGCSFAASRGYLPNRGEPHESELNAIAKTQAICITSGIAYTMTEQELEFTAECVRNAITEATRWHDQKLRWLRAQQADNGGDKAHLPAR
jgi:hypothetical protein